MYSNDLIASARYGDDRIVRKVARICQMNRQHADRVRICGHGLIHVDELVFERSVGLTVRIVRQTFHTVQIELPHDVERVDGHFEHAFDFDRFVYVIVIQSGDRGRAVLNRIA